jgi:hypothetical protein
MRGLGDVVEDLFDGVVVELENINNVFVKGDEVDSAVLVAPLRHRRTGNPGLHTHNIGHGNDKRKGRRTPTVTEATIRGVIL